MEIYEKIHSMQISTWQNDHRFKILKPRAEVVKGVPNQGVDCFVS